MVKLLLKSEQVQVGIVNQDKKTCYEAYNDQFGLDEAASIIENMHLKGESQSKNRASKLFFEDLKASQREAIFDKKTSKEDKQKVIEDHIFQAAGDFSFEDEIRNQIKLSHDIQDRLKQMQA